MYMIKIKNLRDVGGYKAKLCNPWQIRVDRSSVLGNPFPMFSEAQRDEVCDKYKKYFDEKVQNLTDVKFMNELYRILNIYRQYNYIELYCWCSPKRCHAVTIKAWLEYKSKK